MNDTSSVKIDLLMKLTHDANNGGPHVIIITSCHMNLIEEITFNLCLKKVRLN